MDFSAFRSHRICSSIERIASSGRLAASRRSGDLDLRLAALWIGTSGAAGWVYGVEADEQSDILRMGVEADVDRQEHAPMRS